MATVTCLLLESSTQRLTVYMQEGDKFVRLPEVYVKGNNVGSKIGVCPYDLCAES